MAAGASSDATEDSREVVQASEILAAIERGEPVGYDRVIVEGDLDLSGLKLPTEYVERNEDEIEWLGLTEEAKLIKSPINITNSEIRGNVNFSNAVFQEQVKFENSNFTRDVWFFGSEFRGGDSYIEEGQSNGDYFQVGWRLSDCANFEKTQFRGAAFFGMVNFSGDDADFRGANFSNYAYFGGANFGDGADFREVKFGAHADFSGANFSGEIFFGHGCADFHGSEFRGAAEFGRVNFSGAAHFWGVKFNKGANFWEANFSDGASFGEANFNGEDFLGRCAGFSWVNFSGCANFREVVFSDGAADFDGTRFNNAADFYAAQFDKEAYFNYAQFNGTADFNSSWFKEDALFENTTFRGTLSLTRARYNKLFIRWHNIEGGLAYDDTAYLSLLKNFKDLGYFEDYDYCHFEYRKERRNQPWPLVGHIEQKYIRKPIDRFLQVTYGYGTKPLRPLVFSLGIVIGFGAFWRSIGLGRPNEALDEYTLPDAEHDSILEVLAFSATVFLSGTRLFIEPPPLPKIGGRSRSLIRGGFILERVLGALFSILFFLAISGTVVRQL